MKGDFEHPLNLKLELARWLALASLLITVTKAFYDIILHESRLFKLLLKKQHVVVCGLGRVGLQLAREFAESGKHVVALEPNPNNPNVQAAREAGVTVIAGDASDPDVLKRAHIGKAEKIITVCGDEQTNIAVAAAAGKILANSKPRQNPSTPLECWIFIANQRLRSSLQQEGLFPHQGPNFQVNVSGLNLFELAARQVFADSPLDYEKIGPDDARTVHLVIVGFGEMGQHLAIQAAKIGHFANFKKLKITIIDSADSKRPADFLNRFADNPVPFTEICDVAQRKTLNPNADTSVIARDIINSTDSAGVAKELVTFAFCWDSHFDSSVDEDEMFSRLEHDDPTNLAWALELRRSYPDKDVPILIFQTRENGFGALFTQDAGASIGPRMHAFGMIEQTCSMETLLREREDLIAKALHDAYNGRHPPAQGEPPAPSWNELSKELKDSNRNAADHIPIKLRAINYRIESLDNPPKGAPLREMPDGEKFKLLAQLEHVRWCDDLYLQGYRYAPGKRNRKAKTHGCLKKWEDLGDEQEKDYEQIRAIPKALDKAGYGIYPK